MSCEDTIEVDLSFTSGGRVVGAMVKKHEGCYLSKCSAQIAVEVIIGMNKEQIMQWIVALELYLKTGKCSDQKIIDFFHGFVDQPHRHHCVLAVVKSVLMDLGER